MTLYERQQKRHRYKEQTFGLYERRRGWDDLREQHWNMYIAMCETDCQSRVDARNRARKASALGQPWGMGWGGRWEGGFRMGDTCTPMAYSCQCMAKTTTVWTGRPGVLRFMGLQRVRHDWVTKLNWELKHTLSRYEQWYSTGSQSEESHPWQRSWGRKPDKTQGCDQASGVPPGISWASTPKKQSLPALLRYAFHLLFWH